MKNSLLVISFAFIFCSCVSTNMTKYYNDNKQSLDSLQLNYRQAYRTKAFSIAFTDKKFNNVGIEMMTDSIKYIYEFPVDDAKMLDTLNKYGFATERIVRIIHSMKDIKCIWINNLDYYVDGKKDRLIYMSIKARNLNVPFTQKKYNIITYFSRPQYFDEKGRLLDDKTQRKLRRINNDIFKKINDKVCYTVSNLFR